MIQLLRMTEDQFDRLILRMAAILRPNTKIRGLIHRQNPVARTASVGGNAKVADYDPMRVCIAFTNHTAGSMVIRPNSNIPLTRGYLLTTAMPNLILDVVAHQGLVQSEWWAGSAELVVPDMISVIELREVP